MYVLITDSDKDKRSKLKKVSGFPCVGELRGGLFYDRVIKKWTFGSIVKNIEELVVILAFWYPSLAKLTIKQN